MSRSAPVIDVEVRLHDDDLRAALAADVRRALSKRPYELTSVWFYDERGGRLFDEITRLPEYYLTRCERALLQQHSAAIAELSDAQILVELGAGTAEKTRVLLDALRDRGVLERYVPLDVSEQILRETCAAIAAEYGIAVSGVVADFLQHLDALPAGGHRLVAFLGSTIGNLRTPQRAAFLHSLAGVLRDGEMLLLGVDLIKDERRLHAAYNDSRGISADFDRNALRVINHTLQADFDPAAFAHQATWNPDESRMEMRLRARRAQRVGIAALDLEAVFETGDTLLTEVSTKFTTAAIADELETAGFAPAGSWSDGDYALILVRRSGEPPAAPPR